MRILRSRLSTSILLGFSAGIAALMLAGAQPAGAEPTYGIAMHGAAGLAADFASFPQANPDAPKGGRMTFGVLGTFDSLNPFIVKGRRAAGLRSNVFESLMARNYDEPFSLYGLIAQTIDTPADRSWVSFKLNPNARFSDGKKITTDDVEFSWELLRDKGRPNHRSYYSKVARIERPDADTIKFIFGPGGDRELPLLLGLMPILPKHVYETREFEVTSFDKPVGSGPYIVGDIRPGASITYTRNPNYWSADLPVNRGRFNFDEIAYEYFRDSASRFEAFKKGVFDFQHEWSPAQWATGYEFPAIKDGRVVKEEIIRGTPAGMLGLVFNTRRPIFADRRVRQALTKMFDFEWINAKLYHGLYGRTQSFYHGSELSSFGRPASAAERALLAPFANAVVPSVMEGTSKMPVSDGSGRNRANSRAALKLLRESGYEVRDGALVNTATGEPFVFEIMVTNQRQERLSLAFAKALERIGVTVNVRQIDSAQFQKRRQSFDFDMIENFWYASLSPGNEQKFYWGVKSATTEGSRNYMGVREPGIDAMVDAMLVAKDREDFVVAVRALDRILMSGSYVIPLFNWPAQWIARWSKVAHPKRQSLDGYKLDTWWAVPAK